MEYNFDEIIERRGTDAYKLDRLDTIGATSDVLPMWVADMDFATPPFVIDTLMARVRQGVLGYTCTPDKYLQSIVAWCQSHYAWTISKEHINYVPGVVCGIYLAVQTFTEKGDKILIQDPVYHPFRIVPEGSGRQVVWNHLIPPTASGDTFRVDLEQLSRDLDGVKMMILCNPHNPAGICWDRETLQAIAHMCAEKGVIVVSDEIHCDMILGNRQHIPFASVSDEAQRIAITLQAPSKTFNMPGVVCAHAIVPDDKLRAQFFQYIWNSDMDLGNVFCYDAAAACYSEQGDEWRRQMLNYVEGNLQYLTDGLAAITDKIKVLRPQASFLAFLDCRGMGYETQEELTHFFVHDCKLALNPGEMFGPGGKGFMRVNLGSPRSVIEQAVEQIAKAL